jgi:hypothetical protein
MKDRHKATTAGTLALAVDIKAEAVKRVMG